MKKRTHSPHGILQTLHTLALATRPGLTKRVHAKLGLDISHARLRMGESLSEIGIAVRLAVSRPSKRAAIQRLVPVGLMQVLPLRRSCVSLRSIKRICSALFVRNAAKFQTRRCPLAAPDERDHLPALEGAIVRQASTLGAGDLLAMVQANGDFLNSLFHSAGLNVVWPILAQVRAEQQLTWAMTVPEWQTGAQAIADHRTLVGAMRIRNLPRSIQAKSNHFQRNDAFTLRVAPLRPGYFAKEDMDAPA